MSRVQVYIPTPFRRLTGDQTYVEASGESVEDVLQDLGNNYPGFGDLVYDEQGSIPAHVNVYVNNKEISMLNGTETRVEDGDEVAVIPAIAGGATNGAAPAAAVEPAARTLTTDEVMRYSRHIIMNQVGSIGQRKLLNARVLIIGAGGLGSPVALYLALAGVGTIGLVDYDVVDVSNLQRQVLHQNDDVGRPKVESGKDSLLAYNPTITVNTHEAGINSGNAFGLIKDYDIVVNGADNFATRYLVNDAAYLAGKPLVDGAILLFDGQANVYVPGSGCYRCLFPSPPPPGMVPNCAEAGVLGALTGTIGSIQATEAMKLILGIGKTLEGRMLLYDALNMEFRQVKIRRDPACPLCGDNPTITELIDYDAFCGVGPIAQS
ncbi:MAG: molybdopterin-synthase adenylyltransferase MoeB [Dehalococcoidia bacterium]|nr:molybdopterin-synthase adenylyltransferase MoeB [Dehalococcoidia bacterium]